MDECICWCFQLGRWYWHKSTTRACVDVYLVAPHRVEDVVQLDVDGGEGQEAGHEELHRPVLEAGPVLGNLSMVFVRAGVA